ncbi:aromatic acid/H+ symport family MFS transporter, partial [Klebsiella pneumoniae]
QHPAKRIAAILRHIAPLPKPVECVLREAGQVKEKSAIGVIFSPRYAVGTVMLSRIALLIEALLTEGLEIRQVGTRFARL